MIVSRETTFSYQKGIRRKQCALITNRRLYIVYRSADEAKEYPHLYVVYSNDRLPLAIC